MSLELLTGSLEDDPEDLLLSSLVLDTLDLSVESDDLAASPELDFLTSALSLVLDAEVELLLLSGVLAELSGFFFAVEGDAFGFAADAFAAELVEDFEVELVLAGLAVLDPWAAFFLSSPLSAG